MHVWKWIPMKSSGDIILHVGRGKTGSSALQLALHGLFSRGENVIYPSLTKNGYNHNLLVKDFVPQEKSPRVYARHPANEFQSGIYMDRLVHVIRGMAAIPSVVLLSAETLQMDPFPCVDRLMQLFPDYQIHLVQYYRLPGTSQASSSYQQAIRASARKPTPDKLLSDIRRNIRLIDRNIKETRERGISFIPRLYNSGHLVANDVIDDFFSLFSSPNQPLSGFLNGRGRTQLLSVARRPNRSLSAESCYILREHRQRYFPDMEGVATNETSRLIEQLLREEEVLAKSRGICVTPLQIREPYHSYLSCFDRQLESHPVFGIQDFQIRESSREEDAENASSGSFGEVEFEDFFELDERTLHELARVISFPL